MKTNKIAELITGMNEGRAISSNTPITEEEELLLTLLLRKMDPVSQAGLFVSNRVLEKILANSNDSFDQALKYFSRGLMNKTFILESTVESAGTKLKGHYTWFQSIVPKDKDGVAGVEFLFTRQLVPFLLRLKQAME